MQEKQFNFVDTKATQRIFELRKRIRAVAGGTSASKTISILIWLIDYCQQTKHANELCSVVSESYPHLEKGAMLDFENIMKDRGYWNDELWNKTKHTYTFETGAKLEFYSPDTYGKAHGPRRDVLFINEANNLDYKIVDQLMVRTRKIIWMDWNPTIEFWFYTEMLPNRSDDIDFITLTYQDNDALDATTIAEIESHKGNKNWWTVYGLGQLGTIEGRIYKDWKIIDVIPHEARLVRRGLDFGYSVDPTALVDIYYYNGGYILDEQIYRKGLSNSAIASLIQNLQKPETLIIADSAEPKSIDEIKLYDVNILPAIKGAGSVTARIQFVQDQQISVTSKSLNLLKEYRAHMWKTDKTTGRFLKIPEDGNDHAIQAAEYGLNSILAPANYQQEAHVTYNDI
jgi:phage terminase large subunit